MSKEICKFCAEEICMCGEAYKSLGASALEVLIPILVRQYENTPEFKDSMARHVNIYGAGARDQSHGNYKPMSRFHQPGIDSRAYFSEPTPYYQSDAAKDESEQGLRYEMIIPGMVAHHGSFGGTITHVNEQELGSGLRYKIFEVDTQPGMHRYAVGAVDGVVEWSRIGDMEHENIDVMNMKFELPEAMRPALAGHLNSMGHRSVHRKLALMFGPSSDGLSAGLDLGHPPVGFGQEKRAFDYSQVSSRRLAEMGERNPAGADDRFSDFTGDTLNGPSLTHLGRVFRRPGVATGIFTASDMMKYRRLSPGAKFQFLETAGPDFTGEWVVTGFQLFDEDKGPKLQVASIVAMHGEQSVSFYTSYCVDQVDAEMVPFVSMEHIEILNDSWDIVEEPSFSEYKALKVGTFIGFTHLPEALKLEVVEVEYRQKNYGLNSPEQYMVIVKLSIPAEQREAGDGQEFFSFYTGNVTPMNVFYVPGTAEYIPLSGIVFPE